MSYDPLDERISRTLHTKAGEIPIRDRLSELQRTERSALRQRFSPIPLTAAVATFVVAVIAVGGLLLAMRNATSEPAANSTTSTPTTSTTVTSTTISEITYESLHGMWALTMFSVGGNEEAVEVFGNTANPPWVEIDESGLYGSFGCNEFNSTEQPTMVSGVLDTGEVDATAAACAVDSDSKTFMTVEAVFSSVVKPEHGIDVVLTETGMIWSTGDITLSFARSDGVPVATTTPPSPELDIRQESGIPGKSLSICGTSAADAEVRVVFSDPETGETWPDDVDEFTESDERGFWCWLGTFPIQLQSNDQATFGELRPITPGQYEIRVESFGDVLISGSIEVLPGYSEANGPSQTTADAARDGVVTGLAELPLGRRLGTRQFSGASEGIWVLSDTPSYAEITGPCGSEDPDCAYGRDWFNGGMYGELLLMDPTGQEIVRAYPMPDLSPSWLYIDDEHVYVGRIGDGAAPQNTLVRVNRNSLAMTGLIFEDPDDEYSYLGEAIANDAWLDGWQVLTYDDVETPFLTMNDNTIDGVQAPSWIGEVYINLDTIEMLFAEHG